jgi:ubiquitin fusion degradation protein 1
MQNLFMEEGTLISVKNVSLPKAKLMKLRAQNVDFLEISNPRSVLEVRHCQKSHHMFFLYRNNIINNYQQQQTTKKVTLRKFTCVTIGDQIRINHAGKDYYLELVEVEPGGKN